MLITEAETSVKRLPLAVDEGNGTVTMSFDRTLGQFDIPPHPGRDVQSRDSADARRCDDEAGRLKT